MHWPMTRHPTTDRRIRAPARHRAERRATHRLLPAQRIRRGSTDPGRRHHRSKEKIRFCDICGNVCETSPCPICADPRRDHSVICVVEEPKDVMSIERTREYRGLYHVLGGVINPMANVQPSDLNIAKLIERLKDSEVTEVILALNPNVEGEATTSFLSQLLSQTDITVTRLASGLPVGGDLEYADEITLGRALAGRRAVV